MCWIRSSGGRSRRRWRSRSPMRSIDRTSSSARRPTGVGKSLAYLVPGAIWARSEGKVLIVSTHTRNLQDQILRRDLPLAKTAHGPQDRGRRPERAGRTTSAAAMGSRRAEELTGATDGEAFIRALEAWVQLTESGDFEEAPPMAGASAGALSRGSAPRGASARPPTARPRTAVSSSSRGARPREAHVVLVNHALLVIELLHRSAGLPDADALVIDEAHHLPRVAGDALAKKVSARGFQRDLLALGGQGEPGATDRIRRLIRAWPGAAQRQRLLRRIRELEERTRETDRGSASRSLPTSGGGSGYPPPGGRARYRLGRDRAVHSRSRPIR